MLHLKGVNYFVKKTLQDKYFVYENFKLITGCSD
jgi:hypothetical protein